MVTCNICNKEFKNTQGLRGHKNFVHEDTGNTEIATGATTGQQLSKLEQQLSELGARLEVTGQLVEQLASLRDTPNNHSHYEYVRRSESEYETSKLKEDIAKKTYEFTTLIKEAAKKVDGLYEDGKGVADLLRETRHDLAAGKKIVLSHDEGMYWLKNLPRCTGQSPVKWCSGGKG